MQGRAVVGLWARADGAASARCKVRRHDQLRLMVTKGPNRAAVHGTRLPVTETLPNVIKYYVLILRVGVYII